MAEGGGLLNRYTLLRRIEGSNPSVSAISVPEWALRQATGLRCGTEVARRQGERPGIVDLTGDDRAMIYGALLWMADKLQSDQGERVRSLWAARGKQAFELGPRDT